METVRALKSWAKRCQSVPRWLSVALLLLSVVFTGRAAEGVTNEPAKVKVKGFGFFGNREMVRLLQNFQVDGEMPEVVDRTFVEDAALIMFARATDEGFLRAALLGDFQLLDGSRQAFFWTNALDVSLPREFAARSARFKLVPGVRFHYETITFEGLNAFSEKAARSYFVSGDTLLRLKSNRIFNPAELRRSLSALQEAYSRAGYAKAFVTTNAVVVNDQTGAVTVNVLVQEGSLHRVKSVEVTVADTGKDDDEPLETRQLTPNESYSDLWQQELAQKLRAEQYARGFPDATVEFSSPELEPNAAEVDVEMSAQVIPGPLVQLGDVRFVGNKRTKTSLLERRVRMKEGEPLNRLAAERSRQRLARLGVFNSVELQFEEVDEHTRDVIYQLDEIKPMTLSVFGGFGSYELLRGGLEFQHRNVLGRAHSLRLRGMQSFKASKGDAVYTVPELFGENLNVFLQSAGERREEVSFTREEYGGSAGLQKRLVPIQTDFTLRYDYEFLRALDVASVNTNRTGVQEAKAAAFIIELNRDRRDHPLLPRKGLKLYTRAEFASDALGGTVDYQRLILGATYHHDWGGGLLMHLGVSHGISFTFGGNDQDLPFNRRFFPGGENSIRGFQQGEASPVDANGNQLGAETYTQANIEFEQLLTRTWSVVLFCDVVGFAFDRADYPVDETLYSIGAGIRWRTLIGPVRLEYGHNLNRRTHDPAGTLHFSVGFPF